MASSKHQIHHVFKCSSAAGFQIVYKGTALRKRRDASSASARPRPSSEISPDELSRKRRKASKISCSEHEPRSTKLHRAAELADERTVRAILRKEKHLIDIQDQNGETALHVAARKGCRGIAVNLMLCGASARMQNRIGHTPLHTALCCEKKHTAAAIVDVDPGNVVRDADGNTPLHLAAQNGFAEIVRELLAASFNTRVQNKSGLTPLHLALCCRNEDAANVIVDTASVNEVRDRNGDTPLHYAAREGYPEIARKLLAKGASAHVQGEIDRTPLHVALCYGHKDVANVIIDVASGNQLPDSNGDTPLHVAARKECVEVVRKLLAAGVSADVVNWYGFTALHVALLYKKRGTSNALIDAISVIEDHGGDSLLHLAADAGFPEIVKKLLLNHDHHPHIMGPSSRYPLEAALQSGIADLVKMILAACALKGIEIRWDTIRVCQRHRLHHCTKLLSECEEEVRDMKQAKLGSTSISYYDVARANVHKLAVLLTNDEIRPLLVLEHGCRDNQWLDGLNAAFPDYGELIAFKVQKAERRRTLIKQWLDCYASVSTEFLSLPVTIIEVILAFLSDKELETFTDAFNFKT